MPRRREYGTKSSGIVVGCGSLRLVDVVVVLPASLAELDLDVPRQDTLCGVVAFGVPVRLSVRPQAPTDASTLELYIL